MKKLQYIQPQIGVEAVHADAAILLLGSPDHPVTAPMRRGAGEEID